MFTPDGTQVKSLDDIEHGRVYVAAGNEQFRPLSYTDKVTDWHKVRLAGCIAARAGDLTTRFHLDTNTIRFVPPHPHPGAQG